MTNLFIFILGAAIGSFLNVLIERLAHDESINGRSHCDFCKHKLAWYDLIPILSFLLLGARCRYCHKKLSWQYIAMEVLTGIIFVLIYNFQFTIFSENLKYQILNLMIMWGMASCAIVIFFSDLKYQLISDYLLIAFFIFSILFHFQQVSQLPVYVLSGLIVALPIFLLFYLSKERAMGLGDVYLAGIIGVILGWQAGLIALYISFIIGAVIGLILILIKNKKMKSKVAFGPFLIIGLIIMMYYQPQIFALLHRIYKF